MKMKSSKYCAKFQMSEKRGSFQGINTYSIKKIGDFSFTSVLLDESKNRSILMRPDINSLLSMLQIEICISINVVNAMHARADFIRSDLSKFDNYLTGSDNTNVDSRPRSVVKYVIKNIMSTSLTGQR